MTPDDRAEPAGAQRAASTIRTKESASREAPPINPPSTSGCPNSSAALAGLTLPPYWIRSASAMYATTLTRYLYVADTSNQRVIQFSKDGDFERQFLAQAEPEAFAQLQGIAVDELTGKIYTLSGNKLWVASMPQVGE